MREVNGGRETRLLSSGGIPPHVTFKSNSPTLQGGTDKDVAIGLIAEACESVSPSDRQWVGGCRVTNPPRG